MSGSFIDTNVFIYMLDETDDPRRAIAHQMVLEAIQSRDAVISFQVVQETLNVITRRALTPAVPDDARAFLNRFLMPLMRVMPSHDLYEATLEIQSRYRYTF